MDRGRIPSAGALLQLVIGDPWFAWLQRLSGLIVRIDEMTAPEAKATERGRARRCSSRWIGC